jgi:hypothetical protein
VLNVLHSLVDKSNINRQLEVYNSSGNPDEVPGTLPVPLITYTPQQCCGSGSSSQRYGSGFIYQQAKKNKKNLGSYCFVISF